MLDFYSFSYLNHSNLTFGMFHGSQDNVKGNFLV